MSVLSQMPFVGKGCEGRRPQRLEVTICIRSTGFERLLGDVRNEEKFEPLAKRIGERDVGE